MFPECDQCSFLSFNKYLPQFFFLLLGTFLVQSVCVSMYILHIYLYIGKYIKQLELKKRGGRLPSQKEFDWLIFRFHSKFSNIWKLYNPNFQEYWNYENVCVFGKIKWFVYLPIMKYIPRYNILSLVYTTY